MPLRGLAVNAKVVGMVAQVEVSQRYANSDSAPIEAVYDALSSQEAPAIMNVLNVRNGTTRFQFKQEECSIYAFEAIVDDQLSVSEIKEKEEALNAYVAFADPFFF